MDYYDAVAISNRIARHTAVALFALVMAVSVSLNTGTPPGYVWLAAGLVGVLAYNIVGLLYLSWVNDRYAGRRRAERAEQDYAAPEPEPAPVAESRRVALDSAGWIESVDWPGLAAYVAHPDAAFSRKALEKWVDQRFYSPRDGDPPRSFPQIMVDAGAARVIPVNGTTHYVWVEEAPAIVSRIARAYDRSPRPAGTGNGAVQ